MVSGASLSAFRKVDVLWLSQGLLLKGNQPALGQAKGLSTPRLMSIWGQTDVCPGMGEQGLRKPGPLSGPLGYRQGSGGTQAREARGPAMGADWTRACAFWPSLASLHLLEGGVLGEGLKREEGEQDGGLHPPHLLNSELRPLRCRGYHLYRHSPACPGGLIPEENAAWPLQCVRIRGSGCQGGVDPCPPLQIRRLRSQGRMWTHTRSNFYRQARAVCHMATKKGCAPTDHRKQTSFPCGSLHFAKMLWGVTIASTS